MSVTFVYAGPRDYAATDYRPDGFYGVTIQADTWAEAERLCDERGYTLEGKLYATATGITDAEADAILAAMEERGVGVVQ